MQARAWKDAIKEQDTIEERRNRLRSQLEKLEYGHSLVCTENLIDELFPQQYFFGVADLNKTTESTLWGFCVTKLCSFRRDTANMLYIITKDVIDLKKEVIPDPMTPRERLSKFLTGDYSYRIKPADYGSWSFYKSSIYPPNSNELSNQMIDKILEAINE